MDFSRVTTKDVLAVTVVVSTLIFAGISLITGKPLDATTIGFSGLIIGHYFRGSEVAAPVVAEPVPAPSVPGDDDLGD